MRVDAGADAVYLNLTDRPIQESEDLDASKRTDDPAVLKQFSFEMPNVG